MDDREGASGTGWKTERLNEDVKRTQSKADRQRGERCRRQFQSLSVVCGADRVGVRRLHNWSDHSVRENLS